MSDTNQSPCQPAGPLQDYGLISGMPAFVRAFIRRAQALGIKVREGERRDHKGRPLLSLHGSVDVFERLPEMAGHRMPVRRGHWWLKPILASAAS